jgi:hypothetical protein
MAKVDIPVGPRLDTFAEFLVGVGPQLSKGGFWIDLYPTDPEAELRAKKFDWTERAFRRAFHVALAPLLRAAESCRVLNIERTAEDAPVSIRVTRPRAHPKDRIEEWRATYLRGSKGATEIDLGAPGVLDDADFWWWITITGANPALTIPLDACDWPRTFATLNDPTVSGTVVFTTTPAAVAWAKRTAAKGGHVVLTVEKHGYGMPIRVFSAPKSALRFFRTALEHANLTSEYMRSHCTPHVRAMEMGGLALWDEIKAARNDIGQLASALEESAEDVNDNWGVIQALTAAELIAALNGRPPASFGEARLTDHAKVTAWVAKVRTRKRMIDDDTVALARRVVRRIAKRSTFPKENWKTEIYRDAWRRYVADLVKRLA